MVRERGRRLAEEAGPVVAPVVEPIGGAPDAGHARAARTGIRCIANIAATSASRPTRSGAITVTRVPSPAGSTEIDTAPLRTARGICTSSATTGGSVVPESRATRARRARSRISPERHDDHALGAVALA